MKSTEKMDSDLKAKRIVYQMSKELEQTDVNDDFHNALLSLEMPKSDKKAGFDGYLAVQNEIKESLKNYMDLGQKSNLLTFLSGQQLKCVSQMLKPKKESSHRSSKKSSENGEYFGEKVVAKKIQVVEDVRDSGDIPRQPIPFGIPPLQVGRLYEDNFDDDGDDDDIEWVSSQPGRSSSSRIPEIPMEPVPKPVFRKEEDPPKNVTFIIEQPKKIISRARPIEKSDAQIQTDQIEEEEKIPDEKPETAEIGTNCRLLITPRVEEVEEHISEKSSPILSPISTVPSDLSEGEVIGLSIKNVITVRADGEIVPTPRVIEDVEEEEEEDIFGYDGDYEENILIAKSTSSFGVAEVDMSISSAHSH